MVFTAKGSLPKMRMTRLTQREMVTASMPVMACSVLTVRFCRGFISASVVVSTEESYTSKCSFVNNEVLKVYKEEQKKEKTIRAAKAQTSPVPQVAPASSGTRSSTTIRPDAGPKYMQM
ncbi:MAG: hypothetical protein Q7K57_11490 [Burkholderiaceae bacterium]|nr:hypothetical protein [Burkholderiaceae bacterium]